MRIDDLALIRDIAAMERDDIVTLYLPVDPTDPRNQRSAENEWWRSKAKALLSELEVGDGRADRMAFRRSSTTSPPSPTNTCPTSCRWWFLPRPMTW